eukprot:CAMPEP_0198317888 /NCGR_PEP_ID=MMETSP1450-20131203/7300_1 /TAXON_ID=753684 ORGANISM="Madagascaria erythrocladiodes, Strain CCMP3234" /NCGR_SAMPLE_ID=MMETSP1450 /ASSEMBLY_ACC=CAM_ASM_001115 /LENGTH=119 /DNA_ID=CAMNT_0044021141 /DNA_START=64 /DNA_END=423 /DNA_ORIENTATION=+
MMAGMQRAALKVPAGYFYADSAMIEKEPICLKFNWHQRGAQNPLETQPGAIAMAAVGGLVYPWTAAIGMLMWSIGAFGFYLGYKEDPKKRYSKGGGLLRLGFFVVGGAALAAGVKLVRS